MSNELSKNNISDVLESYYPERFQNFSPIDFERLIKFLLEEKFGRAEETNASGDFGGDVIAYSHSEGKIICQVKRYKKGNKVGNKYINDCIGAIEYYDGNKGLVITTSSFTKSAKEIAKKANIELWNWNKLSEEISKHFFEGKDYYDYFSKIKESEESEGILKVNLDRIEKAGATKGNASYNWLYITIENMTKTIVDVSIIDATIINSKNRQFSFDDWHQGYFASGEIYPKAKVEASFNVSVQKAGQLKRGTKVYLKALVDDEEKLFKLDYNQSTNNDNKPSKDLPPQILIKEEKGDQILLKAPISGEFKKWVAGTDGQLIKPKFKIGEIDGVDLKAGIRGYLDRVCVENHTKLVKGEPIIILNKKSQEKKEKKSSQDKVKQTQKGNSQNTDTLWVGIFFIVMIFLIVLFIIVSSNG